MQKISESEMQVMKIIWMAEGPISSAEIQKKLSGKKSYKPTTVLTFLSRLCEKGLIQIEKHGKYNEYLAIVDEKSYKQFETREFIKEIHNGSIKSFIAALCENDGINDDEIASLKEWINKKGE